MVYAVFDEYWKPRWLIDNEAKRAYEFMDDKKRLVTVTQDDVDWDSLAGLPEDVVRRARELDFYFPSFIQKFKNGVAQVKWQLNPDGAYYMDEDGFGMTDDIEVNIYGSINREGKVVSKFKYER
ncbi:MAG: hypothetical protein IJ635_09480 [Bacteroidaceae bacterium]|nr:hypothetical protein [Bacteroidaceae bacterium]